MKERGGKIDKYFRRSDTILAKGLQCISPQKGLSYRNSNTKRAVETAIVLPMAVAAIPVIAGFATAVKIEDRGSSFYSQDRVSIGGTKVKVRKIRSLKENAENNEKLNVSNVKRASDPIDPRSTRVGSIMRPYGIDELPQLWQVVTGEMALVGCRANSPLAFAVMEAQRPRSHEAWHNAYVSAKPALVNMNRALEPKNLDLRSRHYLDVFYAKHASLGFDLYLIYRTASGMVRRGISDIRSKCRSFFNNC